MRSTVEAPRAPQSLEALGVPADRVAELLVKVLLGGERHGVDLADRLAVPFALIEPLVEHARHERLVEVRGVSGVGSAGYRYALTDLGRDRARQYLEVCRYVGPVPVPLDQYAAYVRQAAEARGPLGRRELAAGFAHLVVGAAMLDALGPAVNAGRSLFLYGPPGNGKTVIAEGIGRAIGGEQCVPHALDVDGQIVTLFDPVNHRRLDGTAVARTVDALVLAPREDRRWVRIGRPVVTVGGELTLDMLDLSFNPIAGFYEAPVQLKANGGVLVVDDFGRQRVPPRDLLNRWIVPLESRVDYLTLHTGRKFEVPFDVFVIFATNLRPESLADEAFLRRIPYKVLAKDPTLEEYTRIFEMNCRRRGLGFDPVIVEYLMQRHYRPRGLALRACHPRDLVEHMVDICRYQGRPPVVTRELVEAACATYFLEAEPSQARQQAQAQAREAERGVGAPASERARRGAGDPADGEHEAERGVGGAAGGEP